ncbi:antifreeze protein Maxi-like isoform X2 [Leptopilina boulardi]|uniref:antifreeze protein Maxi-like isoform X2 n=1 Tax=Leptopilina boulardi TaxID=63433 RepID=UPI0021F67946|nr:antifreeze protein Maxi-like isoform X2 [Leptopilina boulardi]
MYVSIKINDLVWGQYGSKDKNDSPVPMEVAESIPSGSSTTVEIISISDDQDEEEVDEPSVESGPEGVQEIIGMAIVEAAAAEAGRAAGTTAGAAAVITSVADDDISIRDRATNAAAGAAAGFVAGENAGIAAGAEARTVAAIQTAVKSNETDLIATAAAIGAGVGAETGAAAGASAGAAAGAAAATVIVNIDDILSLPGPSGIGRTGGFSITSATTMPVAAFVPAEKRKREEDSDSSSIDGSESTIPVCPGKRMMSKSSSQPVSLPQFGEASIALNP